MTTVAPWTARSDEVSGRSFAESADAFRGSVCREDASAFEAALRGGDADDSGAPSERPGSGGDAVRGETSGPRPQERSCPGAGEGEDLGRAAVLEALFRGVSMPLGASPAIAGTELARGSNLGGLAPEEAERLVSRILVGAPEGGSTEVRLLIQDDVLRDTEIWLSRDASGSLSVRMTTKDEGAYRMLAASCAALDEALSRAEASPVRVDVVFEDGESGSDRRSRGLDQLERDEDDEGT